MGDDVTSAPNKDDLHAYVVICVEGDANGTRYAPLQYNGEMYSWLNETFPNKWFIDPAWYWERGAKWRLHCWFATDEDAVLFKLRWSHLVIG